MVQAMINIDERTNRVLNIVKAKHGLKDKSSAINLVVATYEEEFLEPELRPEYVAKIKRMEKRGKSIRYKDINQLWGEIEGADVKRRS